ncbi:MAG TPA: hypothetical protein VFA87_04195 [Rhizomicrobium sp.]|nr:hypothetical protein [Rhizomicrobium sp.]
MLRLDPLPEANAVVFAGNTTPGLSKEYLSGIEDGIYEAARDGVLNGGRVVDVRVTLLDARYHELDSSARTFRLAAITAFRDAMRSADPVLINPDGS